MTKEKTDLTTKIKESQGKNKNKGLNKITKEAHTVLTITNKKDNIHLLWLLSLILFILGILIALMINNIFLIPILSIGLALIPFWWTIFNFNLYKKQINDELESALSTITTSYIRTEDIILAVEENIDYINPPVRETFIFFLNQTRLITANRKLAIENLKEKIDNYVFKEWCDILMACQDNKKLKHTLSPVVAKLSDTRIVTAELETLLYEPVKEFITMAILLVANIPIIRFLNKDWYNILVHTIIGKIIIAILITVIFISLNAVIRLVKPVEYKA